MAYNSGYSQQGYGGGGGGGAGGAPAAAQNLQFFSSQYADPTGRVSGHSTPHQAGYGMGYGGHMASNQGFGAPVGAADGERVLQGGWLAAFGTGGYDDEPPLLEELGINFGHIKTKTLTVLNPLASVDQHIMDDSDLAGPILFCLLFGTFLLLSGKVHFGYIYGCALLGSISLHTILNLMSLPGCGTNYIRSASVLGYCLLPLVLVSFVGVALRMDGIIGFGLTAFAIGWCTFSSSAIFVAVMRVQDMRFLVAYPLALFYSVFGIMSIFSSGGGGGMVGMQSGVPGGAGAGMQAVAGGGAMGKVGGAGVKIA